MISWRGNVRRSLAVVAAAAIRAVPRGVHLHLHRLPLLQAPSEMVIPRTEVGNSLGICLEVIVVVIITAQTLEIR